MFDPIIVNGEILEVVDSAKILGLSVSNNLKWNNHIDQIISKARKRLYFLSQLLKENESWQERSCSILYNVRKTNPRIRKSYIP
jgi:NADH:ubiquinone oxidoreductase subunit D